MAEIKTWFPTSIYIENNLFYSVQNDELKQKCITIKRTIIDSSIDWRSRSDWRCPTFNTLGTYDLKLDPMFTNLISAVTEHVNAYVSMHGSTYKYKCKDAWINIYKNSDYQEYHTHPDSTISAVYYVDVPPGSGNIVWKSPTEPDMLPIKGIAQMNELSYQTCFLSPKPGDLCIFRSYLSHMVEKGTNDEERISIAFNF
jgi:uncharacterized protein (TIGR02466 family)